jgi:hypothetical protein
MDGSRRFPAQPQDRWSARVSLRWLASEVAALIASRVAERDGPNSTETDDHVDRDDEEGPAPSPDAGPFCVCISSLGGEPEAQQARGEKR